MLVLSRKPGERVRLKIGDEIIWIELVRIKGPHAAQLGITASKQVIIDREEIIQNDA